MSQVRIGDSVELTEEDFVVTSGFDYEGEPGIASLEQNGVLAPCDDLYSYKMLLRMAQHPSEYRCDAFCMAEQLIADGTIRPGREEWATPMMR